MRNLIIPLSFFGVVVGILSSVYLTVLPLLFASVFFLIILISFYLPQLRLLVVFITGVVIFSHLIISIGRPAKREMVSSYAYLALSVKGEVSYSATNKKGSLFIIAAESAKIIKLGEVKVEGLFFLFSKAANQYPIGTGLEVVGSLTDFEGKNINPLEGIKVAMFKPELVQIDFPPNGLDAFLASIRLGIKTQFNLAGSKAGAFLSAILLGDKKSLSRELQDRLRSAGVAHLFVVSGFHVAIISLLIYKVLFLLGLSRKKARWLLFIFLPIYGALCGFSLSISRAIMVIFYYILADNGQRRGSVWQALFVAGLVTLIVKPASLFNPGFLLSYGATAGILLFYKEIAGLLRRMRLPTFIAVPFAVSLAAQIAIFPILLVFFGRVNLLAPLVNLVILPFFLGLSLLVVIFVFVASIINLSAVVPLLDSIVEIFFGLVNFWADISFSQLEFNSISVLMVILYYLFMVVLIKGGKIFDRITSNRRNTLSTEIATVFAEERTKT